jgi:hypothetical protein
VRTRRSAESDLALRLGTQLFASISQEPSRDLVITVSRKPTVVPEVKRAGQNMTRTGVAQD